MDKFILTHYPPTYHLLHLPMHLQKPCSVIDAGCDVEPSLPDAATQPHFFKTSGTAAVTVGVAAAVRESLMLSAPADATLSSGLFEDFTREVAARIIQHYWREHVSRQMNPQDCINASIVPQPTMKQADVRTQLGSESNPGEAPGPERDQEDSLAVALMRYRSKDSIQAVVGHTPATVRPQEGTAHLQTKHGHSLQEGTATTAPAARASCGADSSFELARAIGKLKQRQGKQQRFEKPTAQHPKHALPASAELSEATKQDRSATEAVLSASAASGQQAQQAPNGGGSADHHTSLGVLTDSSNELRQEVSDGALLQILNPGWHVRGMAPPVNPPVSTGAMPLQQQLQKPNETGARNDASQPRPGSDENASPNLSPDKPQAQRRSSRIKQVEAVTAAAAAPEGLHHEPDPLNVEKQDHADHADHASDKASAVQETSYMVHSSRLRRRSDRLSSDKLADIFAFLDDVEARAEAEAADAVLPHTVHRLSPTGHQLPQTSLASIRHSASSLHGLSPTRHDRQLQLPTVSELQQNVDRPLHSSVRQPAHEAVRLSSALVSAQIQVATNVGHTDRAAGARAGLQIQPAHGQAVLDTACTAETVSTGQSVPLPYVHSSC